MPRLTGKLLVASPYLTDGNFYRSVVLILRHETSDAFGLVLNRPTTISLADAMEQALGERPARDDMVYWGGPVDGPITAVHADPLRDEFCEIPGMHATTDRDHLWSLMTDDKVPSRFFGGYSGWGPGQLDEEIKAGGWLVAEADLEDVYGDVSELWERSLKRVNRKIFGSLLPQDDGFDPQVN